MGFGIADEFTFARDCVGRRQPWSIATLSFRSFANLSRDSLFAQQIPVSFCVRVEDGGLDGGIQGVHIGKGGSPDCKPGGGQDVGKAALTSFEASRLVDCVAARHGPRDID